MYYVELTNHVELLIYLVIYIQKTYIFLAILSALSFLHVGVVGFA